MPAPARSHLRLAAVDGRTVKGIRNTGAPRPRKLPPKMLGDNARSIAAGIERSVLAIGIAFDAVAVDAPATPQSVTVLALIRDALTNLRGLSNLAGNLADMLEDPSRW